MFDKTRADFIPVATFDFEGDGLRERVAKLMTEVHS